MQHISLKSNPQTVKIRFSNIPLPIGFILIFCFILGLRIANIHNLPLPLWVDSVHHAAIARLIAEQGTLPTSYRPFADVDIVYYHLGFHTLVVAFSWLTGLDIEHALLWLGQLLNVLVCVSLYLLAARWTGHPIGGLTAMIVAGTVSLMPAYYVTWGRYTQLHGLVILPIAMLNIPRALEKGSKRDLILSSILVAGLSFVHYRVTSFLATFVFAYLLCQTALRLWQRQPLKPLWTRAIIIGTLSMLIASPWLWRLWQTMILPLDTFLSRIAGTDSYNEVPWDFLTTGYNPILFLLSSLGLISGLWRNREQRTHLMVIIVWLTLTALMLNPSILLLHPTWIVNNFSAVIALFVPLSILTAFFVVNVLRWLESHLPETRHRLLHWLTTVSLLGIAVWTGLDKINIINPITELIVADDLVAIQWIRDHTPQDTLFLVNMRHWQNGIYVGTDGGYWITNLTTRQTTMPIIFYYQGTPAYFQQINTLAELVASSPHPDDPTFLAMLRARNVTHVYIGAKGGPLSLSQFLASPHYQLLFKHNAVHIFAIHYPP